MARTYTFKGGKGLHGYGYYAYVEDGKLVVGENWPREGGETFRGNIRDAGKVLAELEKEAPALYNSITKYYKDELSAGWSGATYRFNDSRDSRGNGYSGYIDKTGQLVLEYDDPRNGGEYFRGSYTEATGHLNNLKVHDRVLWDDIEKYFTKHGVEDDTEQLKKKYSFDEGTCTVLFKVKLFMDNHDVHTVLIRGRSQAGVLQKLFPAVPEVLTIQTYDANVFAVRSEKIYAAEFIED